MQVGGEGEVLLCLHALEMIIGKSSFMENTWLHL